MRDGTAEPAGGDRTPEATGGGTPLPRLAQFSSLGSRGAAAGDRPGETFARRAGADAGAGREPSPGVVVPPEPAGPRGGDKARRDGFRGALGVVGIVGLLSAGSVLLTLGLLNGHDDGGHGGTSVSLDSGGHDTDAVDGLGVVPDPSRASGTVAGKAPGGSEKPTSASPSGSASGEATASPGKHATASAKSMTGAAVQAAAPGVNVYSHASHRCIDVVGGKAVQGAKLMIWDCAETAPQHWTFTGGTMSALGMCMQLAGGSTADGTDLELGTCDGSPAQKFTLNSRHDLVSSLADKCSDVRDNVPVNGTRLQLWPCSGGANQKWSTS
ncbi:ricin-type beta-trefoil lectin domain protein [Streptomyces sp. NPDC059629]|uniref:ricin-type beta-trefoil lectin domain protein n=1 Tax=Streptomyces sp. NPDC059629 TaxID=3346889 RepID=UPI0036B4A8C7